MEITYSDKLEYQRDEHQIHLIVYHPIWCPKRRKPFLTGTPKNVVSSSSPRSVRKKGLEQLTKSLNSGILSSTLMHQ